MKTYLITLALVLSTSACSKQPPADVPVAPSASPADAAPPAASAAAPAPSASAAPAPSASSK